MGHDAAPCTLPLTTLQLPIPTDGERPNIVVVSVSGAHADIEFRGADAPAREPPRGRTHPKCGGRCRRLGEQQKGVEPTPQATFELAVYGTGKVVPVEQTPKAGGDFRKW